jgi:hypothetical protein
MLKAAYHFFKKPIHVFLLLLVLFLLLLLERRSGGHVAMIMVESCLISSLAPRIFTAFFRFITPDVRGGQVGAF